MEETEDERRERLQKEVEESEIGIAAEMFAVKAKPESQAKSSGSIASGTVATAALQTKKDHETFARVVAERLDASTPLQLHAFMKESTTRLANKLTLDQVTELVEQLEKVRVKKAEAEGPVHSASKATMSKKKKQQKQAERRQEEVFGGQFQYQDEVADQYIDMEDQFM
jgi:deoxyinosine 3'endonuclease (endonuclease V)